MESRSNISFEDTSIAFSYKSDADLRKANFIFSLVNHPWISAMAIEFVKIGLIVGLPIKGIIKKTAFSHFCGGETIDECEHEVHLLARYHVGTILDYSVEGEKSEAGFEQTMQETLRTIENARHSKNIPFSVFKVTGLASLTLLEKIQRKSTLTNKEKEAFERIRIRVDKICSLGHQYNIPVLIDAEETWIQEPIDQLAYEMMAKYNKQRAIVFNTYQLYRTDSYQNLVDALREAAMNNYFLGAKLVRGAYMEKERARAEELGYDSPIHPDKAATDKAFNEALLLSINHIDRIAIMCGSHNDFSNLYLTELMQKKSISKNDERVWFAQLYGMSDNISFNLANAGYNVVKYLPYGPVKAVMPYLFRRAAENTSVAGQSSRELALIRKELKRRRAEK
jgi:proline dehydrogenase